MVYVTMSKGPHTAYLKTWNENAADANGVLGTSYGWSFNRAYALPVTDDKATVILNVLDQNHNDPDVRYNTEAVVE